MTRERPVRICESGEVRFLSATRLPYWVEGPQRPFLIVPYTLDVNDNAGDQFFTWGTEERYVPNLSEADCSARSEEIRKETGWRAETRCIRSDYPAPRRPYDQCVDCMTYQRGPA